MRHQSHPSLLRSIFLESKLKAEINAGSYWPLADATLYGENLGKSDVSEGVAGVIARSLSGSNANGVLNRLLRDTTNALVYSYVDITSYALRANLPADVVRILPWAGVTNGPTGGMPADFWQKIDASASTLVNALVHVGQLIYQGLVALGTFLVNLGVAIWNWGMRAAGIELVSFWAMRPGYQAQTTATSAGSRVEGLLRGRRFASRWPAARST